MCSLVKRIDELHMVSRDDWHTWLEQNHSTKREVWLVFYKKHTEKPSISYDDAVEEALCFGWIDSIVKRIDDAKFARKFTPRKPDSRWSELNKKRANKMIDQGKMTKAGLVLINEAKERGLWLRRHQPKKDFTVPKYIEHALQSNDKALSNFRKLAPSYKRQYVGWVDSAKKEETRRRRLAEIIRILEKNGKLGLK